MAIPTHQLEKDRDTATDELATDDMELRLSLLRRRGELVAHFASCWLESDMRKGIFLADPRDVDSMLEAAHRVHGRQMPPCGWECLGRFSEMAVREHFLEQMRTYMIGGNTSASPPDSPHPMGQQHGLDDATGSLGGGAATSGVGPSGGSVGGVLSSADYGRVRSPADGSDFPLGGGQAARSLGYPFVFYPGDQPSSAAAAAAVSATSGGGHGLHPAAAAAAGATSPPMRGPMFPPPPGSSSSGSSGYYHDTRVPGGAAMRGSSSSSSVRNREGQVGAIGWGNGVGAGDAMKAMNAHGGGGEGKGGGALEAWRPPERWGGGGDMANPSGRAAAAAAAAGSALPSIFELRQQEGLEQGSKNFMTGMAVGSGPGSGGGAAAWGGVGAGGGVQQNQSVAGRGHSHRWEGGAAAAAGQLRQQQQHQALGTHMIPNARWQEAGIGGGEFGSGAGISRGENFDHPHGGSSAARGSAGQHGPGGGGR
ncbi:unnamed protein product [Ectocarpus sp. CCAP 1310/34]|nr:unnamed protein product [Ectocarpus sp. CCAP 1310/34]